MVSKKLLLILLLFSFIGCSPKTITTKDECSSFKKFKFKPCPCGHWRRGATPVK